jgi:predicted RNase H-like HicB family nuclease
MRQHRQCMKHTFTVVLEHGNDGWWVAHAPLLHATAQGKSRGVALRRIQGLIEFALDDMRASGQPVPSERSRVEVVRLRATA